MTKAEETKYVSEKEFNEALYEMCETFIKRTDGKFDGNGRIRFHFDYDHSASDDVKPWRRSRTMQVNWAAIGTVTPDEAFEYGSALMHAAELAANFKYNGYKIRYED